MTEHLVGGVAVENTLYHFDKLYDYLYEVSHKAKGTEYEQILRRDCDLIDSVMNGFDMSLLTRPSSAELNDTPPLEEDVHGLSHVR